MKPSLSPAHPGLRGSRGHFLKVLLSCAVVLLLTLLLAPLFGATQLDLGSNCNNYR